MIIPECEDGFYGYLCKQRCSPHCGGDGLCDKVTGQCLSGCHSGFQGKKCRKGKLMFKFSEVLHICVNYYNIHHFMFAV